jgi:4-alpha-glucanotransferase
VLRERAYEPFIAMLRANMRHAGALRIDHAMGLLHLYWIPAGGPPSAGAYIQYPFDDLLGILALESQRNHCMIIGEDLGTVPEGFREVMSENDILSYRVLYFEKEGDRFKAPQEYPELALACVTTHDLATLSGFWKGADLDLRRRLELYPSKTVENNERAARGRDRDQLLNALRDEKLLAGDAVAGNDGAPSPTLIVAVHEFLARSPAKLLMVQIDDLTREDEQLNLPGTVEERPNWRRRLSIDLQDLAMAPLVKALRTALAGREAVNARPEATAPAAR